MKKIFILLLTMFLSINSFSDKEERQWEERQLR